MNKCLLAVLMLCLAAPAFAAKKAPVKDLLAEADALTAQKKYESAFKLLDSRDPANIEPEILIKKSEILRQYYIKSEKHRTFTLADLSTSTALNDLRGQKDLKLGTEYNFDIDQALTALSKIYPKDYRLKVALGDFYQDVYYGYDKDWFRPKEELESLINENYRAASKKKVYSYYSLYWLANAKMKQGSMKDAQPLLLKSIEMKPDFANAHFNLAYAYLYDWKKLEAIKQAQLAFDLYAEPKYKSECAQLLVKIYSSLNDPENSLKYARVCAELEPRNTTLQLMLIHYQLILKEFEPANAKAKELLDRDPGNSETYSSLIKVYGGNNALPQFMKFLEGLLPSYRKNLKASGMAHFFLGSLYFNNNYAKSKEHLAAARRCILQTGGQGSDMLKLIDRGIKNLSKMIADDKAKKDKVETSTSTIK